MASTHERALRKRDCATREEMPQVSITQPLAANEKKTNVARRCVARATRNRLFFWIGVVLRCLFVQFVESPGRDVASEELQIQEQAAVNTCPFIALMAVAK